MNTSGFKTSIISLLSIALFSVPTLALALAPTGYTATNVTIGSQTGSLTYGTAGSVTYSVTVSGTVGTGVNQKVTLSVSGLPSGATYSPVGPQTCAASCPLTLTITTTGSTPAGTTPSFTLTATGNESGAPTTNGALVIGKATPDISVGNSPVTYNGAQQSATIGSSVAGTPSNVMYDGSATAPTNAGTYAVTADYAPTDTSNYNSVTGGSAGNFVINKASQTITFGALGAKTFGDSDFSVSATSDSGLAVSFASQTTSVCTVSGSTVTIVDSGTCTIRASQSGDTNYNAASTVDQSFTVSANTSQLVSDINAAQAKHDGAVAGTDPGQYSQSDIDNLQTAIDAAAAVRDNASATQTDVDNADNDLASAVATFDASVVPAPGSYTLSYTAGAHGSISGDTPQTVTAGSDGTAVTAVADSGYHFVQWSDASTDNPRTDTSVNGNVSVSATFAADPVIPSNTVSVDGSGCGATPDCYTTVQAGIDAVAAGGTVNVASGNYSENVTIGKALTLNGANVGIAGTSTSRVAESIIDGNGATTILINSNDVTVNGFTVQAGGGTSDGAGIVVMAGKSNINVSNNIITDNQIGLYANCGGNCLVQFNEFSGNNRAGAASGAAIYEDAGAQSLTIDSNDFTNHLNNSAIILVGTNSDITITNNTIHANNTGNSMLYLIGITNGTITGNTITDASSGIKLAGGDSNFTISGNTISGASNGISLVNDGGANTDVTIHQNALGSNTNGLNADEYTGSLDATLNYWGSVGGPAAGSPIIGSQAGNVTFSPWYTDAAMTTLAYQYATSTDTNGNTTTQVDNSGLVLSGTSTEGGNVTVTVTIPGDTNVTGDATWDGSIAAPSATTTTVTIPGQTTTVKAAVEIGSSDHDLTFDRAVRMVFPGLAHYDAGWYNAAGVFTPINAVCSDNTQAGQDANLAAGASCHIDSGSDLVIWTKHFSVFVVYNGTVNNPGSGSGGGGGGGGGPIPLPNNGGGSAQGAVSSNTNSGQVLGAATFHFGSDLRVGSRGDDVTELQKVLIAEGFLNLVTPTGYFGGLTKAAVVHYQKAHGVSPTSGFVGPLTRAELNKGTTPTMSDEQKSLLMQTLESQLKALVAQLQAAVQAKAAGSTNY